MKMPPSYCMSATKRKAKPASESILTGNAKIWFDRYNIDNVISRTFNQCLNDFPEDSYLELSKKLGVSERTLYRWLIKYNIDDTNKRRGISTDVAIRKLKGLGYTLIQPKPIE